MDQRVSPAALTPNFDNGVIKNLTEQSQKDF